jgi:hypothetical protein
MKPIFLSLIIATLVTGCASNSIRVLESTSNRSAPDWTEKQKFERDGYTFFVGSAVSEYASPSGCLIVSDSKALSESGRSLVNAFQDQETTLEGSDSFASKRVISSLRTERPSIEGLSIVDRYSELVRIQHEGHFRVERRCWSLASAPTHQVNSAEQRLSRKLRGQSSEEAEINEVQRKQLESVKPR